MKKVVFLISLIFSVALHAQDTNEDSFGLMQGIADYFFKDDAKPSKEVKKTSISSEVSVTDDKTKSVVTQSEVALKNKQATEKSEENEESFGLMQGFADSLFGQNKEEKSVTQNGTTAENQKPRQKTLKEEINEKEPTTLQNWFDKQLNQGKYDPENMTDENRTRFEKEEALANKQRKIDHEKGFSLQNIVDMAFDQGDYSAEKMSK